MSVNQNEVGEHLLNRAVDLDAVLDHGFDPSSRERIVDGPRSCTGELLANARLDEAGETRTELSGGSSPSGAAFFA
jgi:hypothetical protein